jgi:plastocyanin
MKNAIIAAVVLVLIGGAFALSKNSNGDNKPAPKNQQSSANTNGSGNSGASSGTNSGVASQSEATITYGNNGFSPSTLTVKAGTTVTIKNTSSGPLQFDSDPHPQHTEDPELNVGLIKAGSSMTVTVNTKGSHGYHNHLNAGDTGTIVVE